MQYKPDWLPEQTDLNAFHTKLLLISDGSLKACKNSFCRVFAYSVGLLPVCYMLIASSDGSLEACACENNFCRVLSGRSPCSHSRLLPSCNIHMPNCIAVQCSMTETCMAWLAIFLLYTLSYTQDGIIVCHSSSTLCMLSCNTFLQTLYCNSWNEKGKGCS